VAERDATFHALVSNLEARSLESPDPHDRHRSPIGSGERLSLRGDAAVDDETGAPVMKPASSDLSKH
jgi:hypothetical protein